MSENEKQTQSSLQRTIVRVAGNTTLDTFEEAYFSWSGVAFSLLSLSSFFSLFLFGFFRNIKKEMLPILDLTVAASLSLQFSLFLAAIGLVLRSATFVVSLFDRSEDVTIHLDGKMNVLEISSRVFVYFLIAPAIVIGVTVAFLDLTAAWEYVVWIMASGAFCSFSLFIAEWKRTSNSNLFLAIENIRKYKRDRQFFKTYKSMIAIVVIVILANSYWLGDSKFEALSRHPQIKVSTNKGCFIAPLLGSTSNGLLLVELTPEENFYGVKYPLIFIPFSVVENLVALHSVNAMGTGSSEGTIESCKVLYPPPVL